MKAQCRNCKHYFITYNQQTPRGCKVFKIQSKEMPQFIVKRASGGECNGYDPKSSPKKERNLNDDRYW